MRNAAHPTLTRRSLLIAGLLCVAPLALAQSATATEAAKRPRLVIVPLGSGLTRQGLEFVQQCLEAFYDFEVEVGPYQALPSRCYYAPRRRYRADKLLDFLEAIAPRDASRVVGLTAVDISTTKGSIYDWGVLGLATIDGRIGVLSNFRCQRGVRSNSDALVRFGKVAVHEVGHTLGLEHCPTVGCLMEDAKGTVTTADREYDLCPLCRARLKALGREARVQPQIPWPRPTSQGNSR